MKTISGAVVSSKPVSLSKAAKILPKFALADNGASPAFVAYLRRASDSFDELVQLHNELRGSGSERKSKKHHSGNHVEDPVNSVQSYGDVGRVNGRGGGARKRKIDEKEKGGGAWVVGSMACREQRRKEQKKGKKERKERERRKMVGRLNSWIESEKKES